MRWVLVATLLLLSTQAGATVPPVGADANAGIQNAGVNLFQELDPATVRMESDCLGTQEARRPVVEGAMGRAVFFEDDAGDMQGGDAATAGCGRFVIPFGTPYTPDHIHLRMDWRRVVAPPSDGIAPNVHQVVRVVAGGVQEAAYVPPHTRDVAFPQSWQEDPTDLFPLRMDAGAPSSGTLELEWRDESVAVQDVPLGTVSSMAEVGLFSSGLYQYEEPTQWVAAPKPFPGVMPMSHLEYSFVDIPGRSATTEVLPDGGQRTTFTFEVTQELLDQYRVSIQLDAVGHFRFSHAILPDGSKSSQFENVRVDPDLPWLSHRIPKPLKELLGGVREQITLPVTMIAAHGPGTYAIVVERPGDPPSLLDTAGPTALGTLGFVAGVAALGTSARRWHATRHQMLRRGALIGGRYRLGAVLGGGSEGPVYDARDRRSRRRVALKVVQDVDGAQLEPLRRLDHANLVRVLDVVPMPRGHAIIMERMTGDTLNHRLEPEGLSPTAWRRLATHLASGLASLHAAGLVHRDLKPSNVLFDPSGVAKISDFGLAKAADADATLLAGLPQGTVAYMSPEQALGQKTGAAADVYSLAALLLEAATGRPHAQPGVDESLAEFHVRVARGVAVHAADVPAFARHLLTAA